MKTYLTNLLPRLQQYSQTLDQKELLVDQPWVLIDDDSNKQQYIFERDGKLIMSYNGKVQYGTWRYIPAAKSLVIDRGENDSLLLNHTFVSQGACILKKDGFLDDPWILVNERIVPDLDLENYLRLMLPEFQSFNKLPLDGMTLYFKSNSYQMQQEPAVGNSVTDLKEDNGLINGIFKDFKNVHYFIEQGVIKSIYRKKSVETNKGILTIDVGLNNNIQQGAIVLMKDQSAPDGKYTVLNDENIKTRITIKEGKVLKVQNNILLFWFLLLVFVLIFTLSVMLLTPKE